MPSAVTTPFFSRSITSIKSSLAWKRPSVVHRLPLDIYLNLIFMYLTIEDVIHLRQTCKLFFFYTHEPLIWKRFLECLQRPLPPIRPTFLWNNQNSDYEVEQVVTRAVSLDENWRSSPPSIQGQYWLSLPYNYTCMKFLPGGKYLVASYVDHGGYRHGISIVDIDNPRGMLPIARMHTPSNAYELDAKYVNLFGQHGIMISFVLRRFQGDSNGMSPDDFAMDRDLNLDLPADFMYSCCSYFIELQELESLTDPAADTNIDDFPDQGPFMEVSIFQTYRHLSGTNIFMFRGRPYVALQDSEDSLVVQDLSEGGAGITRMQLQPNLLEHGWVLEKSTIRAMRVLPMYTLEVMVVRTLKVRCATTGQQMETHVVDIFDVPEPSPDSCLCLPKVELEIDAGKNALKYKISELPSYFAYGVDHPDFVKHPQCGPVPISIYAELSNPRGVSHHTIWPDEVYVGPSGDRPAFTYLSYNLRWHNRQSVHQTDKAAPLVLPGHNRAVIFLTNPKDRTDHPKVTQLKRYINPGSQSVDYPEWKPDSEMRQALRRPRFALPIKIYDTIEVQGSLWQKLKDGGLVASAWDEDGGRLGVVAKSKKGLDLCVLDFAAYNKADIVNRF